jgi:hypothetical protein
METSNTPENLQAIKRALENIKPIDQSDFYRQYYSEVLNRLEELSALENLNNQNNSNQWQQR